MSDDLKVTTAELTELGGRQRDAATGVGAAESATDGATMNVARTHGLVCAPTIAALAAAQQSRSAATQAMQNISNGLATKLDSAASEYQSTDQEQGANLDGQMRPR